MTCVVALRHGKKMYMGADSRIVHDNFKFTSNNYPKIIKYDNCAIGYAGNTTPKRVLESLNPVLRTQKDVYKFTKKLFEKLKELDGDELETELLICTKKAIYMADKYLDCFEMGNYWAIGSGSEFALGAMEILNTMGLNPKSQIEEALKTASKYCTDVGPPYKVIEV